MIEIIIIVFVIMIIVLLYRTLVSINNYFIFHPTVLNPNNLDKREKFKDFIEVQMSTSDGSDVNFIYGGLYNRLREPSWDDHIFLYSHGNAGWIENSMNSVMIELLSKYGSVFLYDYRGYGQSTGKPTESGLYNDIETAWNYLTYNRNVNPNKIIIVGHSLGTSVSSHLVARLYLQNRKLPKALILEAPFTTVRNAAIDIHPWLGYLTVNGMNNSKNLDKLYDPITKAPVLPICLIHSKTDEIINYKHSIEIKNKIKCKLITITGTHNLPVYNENVEDYVASFVNVE